MKGMKRTLSDNLLFAARSLLVLAFVVHLIVVVVGYCILPEKIVTRPYPDGDELTLALHNPETWSKEFFLGLFAMASIFMFLIGFFSPYIIRRGKQISNQSVGYWDRIENFALLKNMYGIYWAFYCGTGIFYFIWATSPYYLLNLSSPAVGKPIHPSMMIFGFVLLGPPLLFLLSLPLVKRYRERSGHLPDVDTSETQT